jgi:hypothetical protein
MVSTSSSERPGVSSQRGVSSNKLTPSRDAGPKTIEKISTIVLHEKLPYLDVLLENLT